MPFVPSSAQARRLRDAIERASFSEAERIMYLIALMGLLTLDGLLLGGRGTWVGILGSLGGFALLYWRLRGGFLADEDRELHGIGLRTQAQRAYTALMFRQALTGRNPLRPRVDHDPIALWSKRVERAEAAPEEG